MRNARHQVAVAAIQSTNDVCRLTIERPLVEVNEKERIDAAQKEQQEVSMQEAHVEAIPEVKEPSETTFVIVCSFN